MGNEWRKRKIASDPEYAERFRRQVKDANLRRHFGITLERYEEMHAEQGGLCAICARPERIPGRLLAVDHDHESGAVRGLLCRACNSGLGHFEDSLELVQEASAYLARHAPAQIAGRPLRQQA